MTDTTPALQWIYHVELSDYTVKLHLTADQFPKDATQLYDWKQTPACTVMDGRHHTDSV